MYSLFGLLNDNIGTSLCYNHVGLNVNMSTFLTVNVYFLFLSPDIGQNSDVGISDFEISDRSLIKEKKRIFRIRDDIDMKLGAITKLGDRKK